MSVTTKTRALLHQRAGGCCEICGQYGANNAHHRRNQSQGGPDTLSNLMLLCGSGTTGCHGNVTHNPETSIENGWSIRGRITVAADVKVARFDRSLGALVLVLLTDDGGIIGAESLGVN